MPTDLAPRRPARSRTPLALVVATVAALVLVAGATGSSRPSVAASSSNLRFSAVGDFGSGAGARATLAQIGALPTDLTLALGDLSYAATGTEQAWCDLVHTTVPEGYPFQLLAGNHESNGMNGNINDFASCLPNQLPGLVGTYGRQWRVDVPAGAPLARFIAISPGIPYPDGTWSYAKGTARYAWTEQQIDSARAAGIPWVVVSVHYPCLTIGEKTCESGADLMNLLVAKKVDLVLSGHEHNYQRTKQLSLGATCAALTPGTYVAGCVVDSDSSLVKGRGTVWATVGTGGIEHVAVDPVGDPEAGYVAASNGAGPDETDGLLDVTLTPTQLTAAFVRTGGGTFTDQFTVSTAATNTPPTAVATSACTALTCTFDGSGSSDADGVVAGYTWSFGDGASASGASVSHTYAAGGSYPVTLTVVDNGGAQGVATRQVVLAAPPLARDAFTRTVASGWGVADVGGTWSATTRAAFSVDGSRGIARVAAGAGPSITLGSGLASTDLTATVGLDRVPTGGGSFFLSAAPRRVTGVGDYRFKLRLSGTGSVSGSLVRTGATGEVAIAADRVLSGLTYAGGTRLALRVQAVGTSPTTIAAKVWPAGTAEPAAWTMSATDTTAGLQAGGAVGFTTYVSSTVTNGPVALSVDDVLVAAAAP